MEVYVILRHCTELDYGGYDQDARETKITETVGYTATVEQAGRACERLQVDFEHSRRASPSSYPFVEYDYEICSLMED